MKRFIIAVLALALSVPMLTAGNYKSFKVCVYTRAYEVEKMKDAHWLDSTWNVISSQCKIDKIYLETHRDLLIVPQSTIDAAKKFFKKKGVEVAGGITYTISEMNNFQTFCYSNPEIRAKAQEIAEYTAKNFDEIILDDFFFTNCKCEYCVEGKGDMSWTDYRLKLMADAGQNLVINPAHKVNPNCKVIIKYPNWYDDFQGLGFDLAVGPKIFDGVWTGTETRNPDGDQHLQNYESYNIITYFENLNHNNGGGWVDAGGIQMGSYRYNEQLWLTMFAKAKNIALFDYRGLIGTKIPEERQSDKTIASLCGDVFTTIDKFVYKLGNPVGIKSYVYPNTRGDDFLHNWFGMIGLPMDMYDQFPTDQKVVLLTEAAKGDPNLKNKIEKVLKNGGEVVVTANLAQAVPEVINQFAEFNFDGYTLVNDFGRNGKTDKDILIKKVRYFTNDSWATISAGRPLTGGTNNFPLLLRAKYLEGNLYVLNVPEDYSDLYELPEGVLNQLRQIMSKDLKVRIEGPSKVSLFVYDNDTFIVESFCDEPVDIKVITEEANKSIENIVTGAVVSADAAPANMGGFFFRGFNTKPENRFSMTLEPHTYQVFKLK